MTDLERRALLEYHAKQLISLTVEPRLGYGLVTAKVITEHLQRMLQIAKELEPT